jgi:gas vesicle protein
VSQLQQLKSTINSIAEGAKKTGSSLASFDKQFSQQAQAVEQAIGGSTQGKDKQVVQAIQQASKAVKQAAEALQNAAKIASSYGQSL